MGCTVAINNYMRPLLFRYRLAAQGIEIYFKFDLTYFILAKT
jgi:hypothetical protein